MTRTGQAAIDYARGRVGKGPPPPTGMAASGYCLAFVRECFDVPSYYGSAIDAWNASPTKHPGDRNPPPAVPLFFLTPSVYDHIVFGGDPAAGEIVTTFNADVRRYTASSSSGAIDAVCRDFQGTYLGWTEDVNRVTVYSGEPVPTPTPTPSEVPLMRLIRIVDDGRIVFVAPGLFQVVPTMDRANALAAMLGPWVDLNVGQAQYIHDQIVDNLNATGGNLSGLGFT